MKTTKEIIFSQEHYSKKHLKYLPIIKGWANMEFGLGSAKKKIVFNDPKEIRSIMQLLSACKYSSSFFVGLLFGAVCEVLFQIANVIDNGNVMYIVSHLFLIAFAILALWLFNRLSKQLDDIDQKALKDLLILQNTRKETIEDEYGRRIVLDEKKDIVCKGVFFRSFVDALDIDEKENIPDKFIPNLRKAKALYNKCIIFAVICMIFLILSVVSIVLQKVLPDSMPTWW